MGFLEPIGHWNLESDWVAYETWSGIPGVFYDLLKECRKRSRSKVDLANWSLTRRG